jgi:hypothetical protein
MYDESDERPTAANAAGAAPAAEAPLTPALERFTTCRWRAPEPDHAYCTHRDVLPIAGRTGFNPEAWCPDCTFFKLRRTPRKRPVDPFGYGRA